MRQKLTEASEIYFRLKNIVMKLILEFYCKSTLFDMMLEKELIKYFINDDAEEADTFKILFDLLHFHYFSHLVWSQLTLNLNKSKFFAQTIEILDHTKNI